MTVLVDTPFVIFVSVSVSAAVATFCCVRQVGAM
jgi:hypothetical protein